MKQITYQDLSGQLKFAAWGAIVNAWVIAIVLGIIVVGIFAGAWFG